MAIQERIQVIIENIVKGQQQVKQYSDFIRNELGQNYQKAIPKVMAMNKQMEMQEQRTIALQRTQGFIGEWADRLGVNTSRVKRIMSDTGLDHPDHNVTIKELHYFVDMPVAKLFSSEKIRSEDNDIVNKAINQSLNALIYYRNRDDIVPEDPKRGSRVLGRVSYPIIVVNSFERFYRTNMSDDKGVLEKITEPFQLEVNYAYTDKDRNGRNEYFLIDVVSIDKLGEFLSALEKADVMAISEKMRWDDRQRRSEKQNLFGDERNSSR